MELLWLQIVGSIAGGVVGGFSGFIASTFQDRKVRRSQIRNIASGLIGEIGALSQLFETHYLEILKIDLRGEDPRMLYPFYHVRGDQDYMPIFRSLGGNLGLLPAPLPQDLVTWYTNLAVGLERARAMHDLAIRQDALMIEHLIELASTQHITFTQLVDEAKILIQQLADL